MHRRPRRPHRRTARPGLLVAGALLFVACGDATGPRDDRLSEVEVRALLEVLQRVGTLETGIPAAPSPGAFATRSAALAPSRAPAQAAAALPVDLTRSCPGGGSLQVNGSVNAAAEPATGSSLLTVDLVKVHRGCAGTAASGQTFAFDGDPDLHLRMDLRGVAGSLGSVRGTVSGSLRWTSGDRAGRCAIDLLLELSSTEGAASGLLSGTVCGLDVGGPVSG